MGNNMMEKRKIMQNSSFDRKFEKLKEKNSDQPEFIQAVKEVLESLEPVIKKHPEYQRTNILERIIEPDRQSYDSQLS